VGGGGGGGGFERDVCSRLMKGRGHRPGFIRGYYERRGHKGRSKDFRRDDSRRAQKARNDHRRVGILWEARCLGGLSIFIKRGEGTRRHRSRPTSETTDQKRNDSKGSFYRKAHKSSESNCAQWPQQIVGEETMTSTTQPASMKGAGGARWNQRNN